MKKKLLFGSVGIVVIAVLTLGLQNGFLFTGNGTGVAGDPYIITTCEELQSIDDDIASQGDRDLYWLGNDIDCSVSATWNPDGDGGYYGFLPIGTTASDVFKGTLDGRNFTISNLYINRPDMSSVGLFRRISDSRIHNLTILNADVTGDQNVGILAGRGNYYTISGVHIISSQALGNENVGGFLGESYGFNLDDTLFENSSVVDTDVISNDNNAGGFIGSNYYGFSIRNSFADINIIADVNAGGFIGHVHDACGVRVISRSYTIGNIEGQTTAGGFVGLLEDASCNSFDIEHSFSDINFSSATHVGGLVGRSSQSALTIENSYFNEYNAGTDSCIGSKVSGSIDDEGCNSYDSSAEGFGTYLMNNTADDPLDEWNFASIWNTSSVYPSLRTLALREGPDAVESISAVLRDRNTVDVTWEESLSTGSFPVQYYKVQLKYADDDWSTLLENDTYSEPEMVSFEGLLLGKEYTVRIAPITSYSAGPWSDVTVSTADPIIYEISSCQELQSIGGLYSPYDTYVLTQNIDCSSVENFNPIDFTEEWGMRFRGIFDGRNFSISNLTIDIEENEDPVGLFSSARGATFKNLTLLSGSIIAESEIGALVGHADGATVENVKSYISITATQSTAGGLIGRVEADDYSFSMYRSASFGPVTTRNNAGGLIGKAYASDKNIVISQSYSTGDITLDNEDGHAVGGLIGFVEVYSNDNNTEILIQDSYTTGTISGSRSAGGIIGYVYVESNEGDDGHEAIVRLRRVYVSGNIHAIDSYAGGLIGATSGYYYLEEFLIIENSFVAGSVISGDEYLLGVLIGEADYDDGEMMATGNYFDQNRIGTLPCSGSKNIGGCTGVNLDNSNPSYFYNNSTNAPLNQWNFSTVWLSRENNTPILRWYETVDNSEQNNGNNAGQNQSGSGSSISSSIKNQVSNLTRYGNTEQAEALKKQWPHLYPEMIAVEIFSRNFSKGDVHIDVLELQKFLNNNGYIIALAGPGSKGRETNIFGLLTEQALVKFQREKGLTMELGQLGIETRKLINEIIARLNVKKDNGSKPFIRNLEIGMRGDDVRRLQEFLVSLKLGIAGENLRAHGTTDFFGGLTRAALIEYQKNKKIVPAVGYFGPITRASIQ